MILRLLVSEYLADNLNVKSPHTQRLLETSVKHFASYLGKEPEVSDLTDRNLAGYIRYRQSLKKAAATIEREAAKLMCLWRFASSCGFVTPPRIRIEKAQPAQPVAFLRGEVGLLFREARRYPTPISGVPGNRMLSSLLWICWDSAERIGAIAEIDLSDIQIVRRWHFIAGGWITFRSRKNGGRPIIRKIRRATAKAIVRHLEVCPHRKPYGFVHRGTLYYHLEQLLKRAGLPTSRRHKFHCLRKSHASYLHAAGGNSQDSLEHSDAAVTRKYYHDPRITRREHAIDRLFNPLGWWARLLSIFGL